MTLSMHGKWGDPRQAARAANANAQAARSLEAPHGLMPQQIVDMQRRFETFLPKLAGRHGSMPTNAARFFDRMLPPGAGLDPNAGAGLRASLDKAASLRRSGQVNIPGAGGSSGGSFSTPQTPYQPEFSSPDRQSYPVHRQLANIYWRMFYKLDPIVGTGIDMRSEMVWSNFTFTGEGVAGEIKDALDEMVEQTKLRAVLPFLTREFEVLGEVCPHLFYDDNQGIWTHIAIHNPDQLEVIWAPFLKMEPLVEFKPDDRLRQIITSPNPMLRAWRDSMPDEIKMALAGGRNIPLSPLNATFIPRRLHPYDVRGTSIMSRMWRLFMYEDCLIAGTRIAMANGASKAIEEVQKGDVVLDRFGYSQQVEAAVERPAQQPYEITLFGGTKLTATATHQWPVWAYPRVCGCGCGEPTSKFKSFVKGHVSKDMNIDWRSYDAGDQRWSRRRLPSTYEPVQKLKTTELREQDYLMVPRTFCERETQETAVYARLLGYYLAEGSVALLSDGETYGVHFDLHEDERETWAADITKICAELGVTAHTYPVKGRRAISVHIHTYEDAWLANKLAKDGARYAHGKQLSEEVMAWSLPLKKELLIGYLRGDGSVALRTKPSKSVIVSATTVSDALADQIWLLAAQVGWPITHREKTKHNGSDGKKRRLRNVMVVQGPWADEIAKTAFGIDVERGNLRKGNAWSKVWLDDAFVYYPIKKIKKLDNEVPVFGLTVANDHSYVANGIATFNSIYNASIAVARRAASPLKVAKLGDAASGWIPGPESEQHLLELLAMAETDPTAWLVYNYAVNFDLVGVQERSWKIEQSSEYIERMKLIALGISKAFLWGEVTYASAQSGLTVFLRRLKATREYFESMWLYPKFLRPVAVMNRWIKPTEAELAHNVRTKRSVHELHEGNRFIVPKFEWEQSLDPSIDTSMIAAMKQLKDLGVEFSKSTYASLVNRDFDTELQQRIDDALHERKVMAQHPELQTALGAQPGAGGGGGGGGDIGGMLPALPPEAVGLDTPPPEGGEALPPEGLPPEGGEPPAAAAGDNAPHGGTTLLWDEHGRFEGWTKDDAADLAEVMRGEHPSEAPWERMVETWREQAQQGQRSPLRTLAGGEPVEIWSEVKDYLLMEGYPPKQVRGLEAILRHERVLPAKDDPRSPELLDTVGELGDAEFWTGAAQR